jgi:hypothetical protein
MRPYFEKMPEFGTALKKGQIKRGEDNTLRLKEVEGEIAAAVDVIKNAGLPEELREDDPKKRKKKPKKGPKKKATKKKKTATKKKSACKKKGTKKKRKVNKWAKAIKKARKNLGITGFVLINRGTDGKALYKEAKRIHKA